MNNQDIRVICLYKFKLGKTAIKIDENINLAFEEGYANGRTLQHWCEKFKIGDFALKMS
ncbi:Histone-lysine N-methyltransferase SETMAR [Habropoda laboriosa]|uniref:Histone-lysine N-methyltransferase SETMAR n=1 Tax=Habropoda laboriosa TaxID=597456 RepID=A0A0L7QRF5_9HYME|nr:Histone-lysine N-methyltransferase SETMAR [Habropoda laboriosa]